MTEKQVKLLCGLSLHFYELGGMYSMVPQILSRYRTRWNINLEYCPFSLRETILGTGIVAIEMILVGMARTHVYPNTQN